MSLITIVTMNYSEGKKIEEILSQVHTDKYRVQFEFLRPLQLSQNLDANMDLLVFNNQSPLNFTLQQQIAGWRRNGFLSSILLLSKVNDPSLMQSVENIPSCVVLEKPFEEKDLKGIAEKFLSTKQVMQRKYRRYSTQQSVKLSSYKSDFHAASRVQNMSMGGLCLEGSVDNLQVGDVLKINFPLDKLNIERVVSGKVVWVDKDALSSAGVQFMKDTEVYNHLLQDIG